MKLDYHMHFEYSGYDFSLAPVWNSGSASRPRDDQRGSFIVMELQPSVEPKVTIIRMK